VQVNKFRKVIDQVLKLLKFFNLIARVELEFKGGIVWKKMQRLAFLKYSMKDRKRSNMLGV